MPATHPVFAAPISSSHLPQSGPLNDALRALFLEAEAAGSVENPDRNTHRNEALFESKFDLFDWPHPEVRTLRDHCMRQLYEMIGQLNGYDIETQKRLHSACESWFHITRKSGYFGVHNHPLHAWSGVYSVCQEGDDPASDSGRLTFVNPNATMYMDMSMFRLREPYNLTDLSMRLEPGQLVLFPSWLRHYVTPFQPSDEGLRITVAFNARFRMEGPLPVQPGR